MGRVPCRAPVFLQLCFVNVTVTAGEAVSHQAFDVLETPVVAVVVFVDDLKAPPTG